MWSGTQIKVFVLTFTAYALIHAERKTFSNMKSKLHTEWALSETFMGECDTVFMLCYAVSLVVMGIQVDRWNAVYVLCTGLFGSAICLILFAYSHVLHYDYSIILLALMGIHGILQATGWPSCVVLISRYFKSNQGATFGIWSSNQCVGNISGTLLTAWLIDKVSNEMVFVIPAMSLVAIAVVILGTVKDHPITDTYTQLNGSTDTLQRTDSVSSNIELSTPSTPNSGNKYDTVTLLSHDTTDSTADHLNGNGHLTADLLKPTTVKRIDVAQSQTIDPPSAAYPALSLWEALQVRGVLNYSLAHAFTKYVNYTCFFWLPFYLWSELGFSISHSDSMSTVYDLGSIVGSTAAGLMSDSMRLRTPIICLFALLSCASIMLYDTFQPKTGATGVSATSDAYAAVVMLMSGILIGGPAGLLPSACTADLCRSKEMKSSTGTITGIVDGTGSVGGGVGPVIVAYISVHYGWPVVFYTMAASMLCSILCMSTMLVDDIKAMLGWHPRSQQHKFISTK